MQITEQEYQRLHSTAEGYRIAWEERNREVQRLAAHNAELRREIERLRLDYSRLSSTHDHYRNHAELHFRVLRYDAQAALAESGKVKQELAATQGMDRRLLDLIREYVVAVQKSILMVRFRNAPQRQHVSDLFSRLRDEVS
jgi:uncharacterized protein YPO0396